MKVELGFGHGTALWASFLPVFPRLLRSLLVPIAVIQTDIANKKGLAKSVKASTGFDSPKNVDEILQLEFF